MPLDLINVGAAPNDFTGDPLRNAFIKINSMFTELYAETETDPTVPAEVKAITSGQISNWDTAYSWGDHVGLYASAGHSHDGLAPAGGTTGQVLKKVSNTSYDYSWQNEAGGASYTFSNGLTESGGDVKLGGDLTENTSILSSTPFSLNFGTNSALLAYSEWHIAGLYINTGTGNLDIAGGGLTVSSLDDYVLINVLSTGESAGTYHSVRFNQPNSLVGTQFIVNTGSVYTNTIRDIFRLDRSVNNGVAGAVGLGSRIAFFVKNSNTGASNQTPTAGVYYSITNVTPDSEETKYGFSVVKAGVESTVVEIDGFGARYLADYSANFSGLSLTNVDFVYALVFQRTAVGDVNYSILTTDIVVATSANLTTNREWTLPSTGNVGKEIVISDEFQGINSNYLIIKVGSGKKLNQVTDGTFTIKAKGKVLRFICDGNGNWNYDNGYVPNPSTGDDPANKNYVDSVSTFAFFGAPDF